jgi:hypothetical protein
MREFLIAQAEAAESLNRRTDRVRVVVQPGRPPTRHLLIFDCRSLVAGPDRRIVEADRFIVGVNFSADHLDRLDAARLVCLIAPLRAFHPNIRWPRVCVGHLYSGSPLVDIVEQIYDILTYRNVTMREEDALNPSVCAWARANASRFPIDERPLFRPTLSKLESGDRS